MSLTHDIFNRMILYLYFTNNYFSCLFYRDCPLALEAALGLLALGVKGAEVASLMMVNNPPSGAQMDW